MHTFKASDGTVFKFNPDLSDVRVNVNNADIDELSYVPGGQGVSEVKLSGDALTEFFAEYIRRELITELERLSVADVLRRFR